MNDIVEAEVVLEDHVVVSVIVTTTEVTVEMTEEKENLIAEVEAIKLE